MQARALPEDQCDQKYGSRENGQGSQDSKLQHQQLDPITYEGHVFEAGLHSARPPFTFQSDQWEPLAKTILSANSWGYVNGNCGQGSTYRKNLAAFDRWSIVPRRLVPSTQFSDTTTEIFGLRLPFPLAIAPIGVQRIFNEGGERATARAAASLGIPYTLSTASSTSIEAVAEANGTGSPRWFQLYWPDRKHDDVTLSMLNRAKKSGYTALFVTLDTYVLGWRPSDMDNGYNPFIHPDRIGVEIGLTDPVFRRKFKEKHGYEIDDDEIRQRPGATGENGGGLGLAAREWAKIVFPGYSHSWEDVRFLKENWDGPIVLKGIQSVEDAKRCVEAGVQGIVVSNHGGRQQDGGVSSLGMLPHIAQAVGDQLTVFFDSGVRCGSNVMKAVALGAKCVLIGRPYAYGLALGGEEGVRHVLRSIAGDFTMNMHLAGARSLADVNRDILVKEDEVF